MGSKSSDKAMFSMVCRGFAKDMLEVGGPILSLQVIDHTPTLTKYVSQPYECKEDRLVSIILHPSPWEHNGFLWDFAYPEIQWRL